MAAALGLQADSSTTAQYAQNISTLQNHSDLIANALQQLKTISDRVSELATESSDSLSTPTETQANALADTRDENGARRLYLLMELARNRNDEADVLRMGESWKS